MAYLGGTFDAAAEQNNSSSVVPEGEYGCVMVKSEVKETKNGDGRYLNCEFKIIAGKHQNRTLFHMFNMWLASEKANEIGRGQFSEMCRAVEKGTVQDSEELHSIPFIAKVKVHSDSYGEKNKIVKFMQMNPSKPASPKPAAKTPATVPASGPVEPLDDDIPF